MSAVTTKSFTGTGSDTDIRVAPGESANYALTGTFSATLILESSDNNGQTWNTELSTTAVASGTYTNNTRAPRSLRWRCSARASGTAVTSIVGVDPNVVGLGVLSAQGVGASVEQQGSFFKLTLSLAGASVAVTDAAGDGSFGALKLFDFNEGAVAITSCAQKYTSFAEGAALTTAAGDAVFKIGVASTAIAAAADAVLADAEQNVGDDISITLSAGTGTGSSFVTNTAGTALNGTSTAADLYLNVSGSAATIDATSTLSVTGTIVVTGILLGDF